MSKLDIAGLQLDIAWHDPQTSLAQATFWLDKAVAAGAQVIVLAEMFATGFSMDTAVILDHSEAIDSWAREMARSRQIWLIYGCAEKTAKGAQNALVVVDPDGKERHRYHKIHPFSLAGEDQHYRPGDRLISFEIEGLRICPLICYDLRFPELFRIAANDTDLFIVIANWPASRRAHWRTLLRARAIENQAYLLAINRVGRGGGLDYSGDSVLVDPLGNTLVELSQDPAILLGQVDSSRVSQTRQDFSFLADRRTELYNRLDSQKEI